MVMEKAVARLVLEAVIETVVQVVGPRQCGRRWSKALRSTI